MRTVFEHSGIKVEVTSGEALQYREPDGCASFTPDNHGAVGFAVHTKPLPSSMDDKAPERTVALFYLRPSEARALGSAILSAAAETSAHRVR